MRSSHIQFARPTLEVLEERIALSNKGGHGGGKPPSEPPAAQYDLIDIGTLSGHSGSGALDVSSSGAIVGGSYGPDSTGNGRAVIIVPEDTNADGKLEWYVPVSPSDDANDLMMELETIDPDDLSWSIAKAINDQGQVVGSFTTTVGESHAFLITPQDVDIDGKLDWNWDPDNDGVNNLMTVLDSLGGADSWVNDMNEQGQAVGWSTDANGKQFAVLWDSTDATIVNLGGPDGIFSEAYSINESGQIVGTANLNVSTDQGSVAKHGFVITPEISNNAKMWFKDADGDGANDLMVDLGVLVESWKSWSVPRAINDSSVIVGDAKSELESLLGRRGHAVRWTESSGIWAIEDLGGLHGRLFTSVAWDVNNDGHVVGHSQKMERSSSGTWKTYLNTGEERAFVDDGEMKALDTLVSDMAGFSTLNYAYGISDNGHITGWGQTGDDRHGFVAVTISSGSSIMAATLGSGTTNATLTVAQVRPLLDEATGRLKASGVDVSGLTDVQIVVADLSGTTLGRASANTIFLDINAAGWGWFIDATPWDDSEFTNAGNQGEQNHMDLLTVIMHELGHVLGYEHAESGFMQEALAAGQRHLLSQPGAWEAMLFALAESDDS